MSIKPASDQQEAEVRSQATALNQTVDDGHLYLTCGSIIGKLHKDRFYCPGIHMECIEASDGRLVTPKMFVKMGEKEKLKDWKTAVRVNGIPIRRYMEHGYLDFYRHKETCTMRCLSRSITQQRNEFTLHETGRDSPKLDGKPIVPKSNVAIPKPGRAIPVSLVAAAQNSVNQMSNSTTVTTYKSILNMAALTKNDSGGNGASCGDSSSLYSNCDYDMFSVKKGNETDCEESLAFDMDQGDFSSFEHCKDSQVFWQGILQVGLLDNVIQDIVSAVQKLKTDLLMSSIGKEESRQLSMIVERLGLMDQIRTKVAQQRCEMLRQKDVLKKEMEELKRKVAEAEMKEFELKRKSECFDQLMEMSLRRPNISSPSPVPSDRSEMSTLADDVAESEHSEISSDDRASVSNKRSRKPKRTVRIPQEDGNVSENGYKSEEFEPELSNKRKNSDSEGNMDPEKRTRHLEGNGEEN